MCLDQKNSCTAQYVSFACLASPRLDTTTQDVWSVCGVRMVSQRLAMSAILCILPRLPLGDLFVLSVVTSSVHSVLSGRWIASLLYRLSRRLYILSCLADAGVISLLCRLSRRLYILFCLDDGLQVCCQCRKSR